MTNMNGSNRARRIVAAQSLQTLYTEDLKDIYWAEKHLLKVLPMMAKAAESAKLKAAFQQHLAKTEEHVVRVENAFSAIGIRPSTRKCEGIRGLAKEGEAMIQAHEAGSVRDAGLIIAAQKVEHYEIAAYGSLRNLARTMGFEKAAELLQITLDEEAEADRVLSTLSDSVNERAYVESQSMRERAEAGFRE